MRDRASLRQANAVEPSGSMCGGGWPTRAIATPDGRTVALRRGDNHGEDPERI